MLSRHIRLNYILAILGCSLTSFAGFSWAGSLDDYLANPPKFDNPPWHPENEPSLAIPSWLKQLKEGKTDTDKAVAVGNLVITAARMSKYPEAQAAAIELMDVHVMPNLEVTKRVDISLSCSWRGIVLDCVNFYKKLGNIEAERKCLELYIEGVDLPQDRDFGLYLLAHHHASQEDFAEAIKTMQKIRDDGNMASNKIFFIPKWNQKMTQKEAEAAKKLKLSTIPDPSKNEILPK